ncbi:hypothetical protein WJX81_004936 [Elliptochloris bilobata]|uniref:Alkyl transferase n=1 Tax=Elliptochloris bilobata TaxID=381761 RepID=A0AAW1RUJ0_9CHLO
MDGNRRFAERRREDRAAGHTYGFYKLVDALEWCLDLGITTVSVYAFSMDNFKRPPAEVATLMALAHDKLRKIITERGLVERHGVRVRVLGDLARLPPEVQAAAEAVIAATAHHTRGMLNICFAYSSRQEMAGAVRAVQSAVSRGQVRPQDVTAEMLAGHLYTQGCPPVDLLLRTSGEARLSDFLLWQAGGAQLAFARALWPELSFADLLRALVAFQAAAPRLAALRAAVAAAADKPGHTATLDAVEQGCSSCEQDVELCNFSVGYGGSPDEAGQTTLDAVIMDGTSMEVGAVGNLRRVRQAISAARRVLENSKHTLLAGFEATEFAYDMGFPDSNLSTPESSAAFHKWRDSGCQPNFRRNGQQALLGGLGRRMHTSGAPAAGADGLGQRSHDTIAMVAIDADGRIAAGASTNGMTHKIPGRVGDAAVAGGAVYADSEVGACGSTGDGDAHLRFLPCFQVVEAMRRGIAPREAAEAAIARIARFVPGYVGALFAVDSTGSHAGAAYGWNFQYAIRNASMTQPLVIDIPPLTLQAQQRPALR